ncbi:hypothetical protein [Vibrio agarivorans]|uniref:hypothetical protein n=1 Tax=Vibrio agarivorans TaxID=153622 RepID=UPI0025B4065E|nr:hypothetical protein [Vibrio agarivorans]MDN3659956.1 hypothetical protein [Vibrio agarivorans]
MANIFDQFDEPAINTNAVDAHSGASGNVFDQFDEPQSQAQPSTEQPTQQRTVAQDLQDGSAQLEALETHLGNGGTLENFDYTTFQQEQDLKAFAQNQRVEQVGNKTQEKLNQMQINNPANAHTIHAANQNNMPKATAEVKAEADAMVEEFTQTGSLRSRLNNNTQLNDALEQGNLFSGETREAFQRGVSQGATFGFADEMSGGVRGLINTIFGEGSLGDNYREARDESRANVAAANEAAPAAGIAGEVVGGVGAALPAAPATGVGLGSNLLNLARVGAVEGGIAALGGSEADLTQGEVGQAAIDTGVGAAIGGLAAPVIGGAADAGIRTLSRLPFAGLNRLQGTERQRAQNSLVRYIQGEVDAGRMNRDQILSEIDQLRSGAVEGADISLADLNALQALTARVNQEAGRPSSLTPADQANLQAGGTSPTYGSLVDDLANRQQVQQEGIRALRVSDDLTPNQVMPGDSVVPTPAQVDPSVGNTGQTRPIANDELIATPDNSRVFQNSQGVNETMIVDEAMPNLVQLEGNMKSDLNNYTSNLYTNAYNTTLTPRKTQAGNNSRNLPPQEVPNDLANTPAFKEAWNAGRKAARNNRSNPSQFQELDYTKRALDEQIRRADGGTRADLVAIRNQLNQVMETASPDFANANTIQSTYRQQYINQFENSRNYFNMNAEDASNVITDVAKGDIDIASISIGREISDILDSGARTADGAILTQQQVDNYTRLLEPDAWNAQQSTLGRLINTEARMARTQALADITTAKGLGAEAESALRTVLGQDDLAMATVMAGLASPNLVAVPWMVNRAIATEASQISQQRVYREMQKELYQTLPGDRATQNEYINNIFSFQFEKVPTDVLRTFFNTFTVGGSNVAAQNTAGEATPRQLLKGLL